MKQQKLQTELLALCDYAMIDQTNKVSIIGIFNEMNVASFPGGLPRVFLVAVLVGSSNETYQLTVTVQDTDGKDAFPPLHLETKTGFAGKNNVIITINNFAVPHAGEYTVHILEKGKEFGATSLHAIQTTSHEANGKITN